MKNLEQAIKAIEHGLMTAARLNGCPLNKMDLRERMAYYKVPGFSIALIDQDELVWAGSYGVLKAGGDNPVTGETIFQAGSISKSVTALLALHLVEAGLLNLDADVNQALRSWQVPENEHTREYKVTLGDLLSHTAGLTVYGYRGYPHGFQLPTLLQILDGRSPAISDPVRVMQAPGSDFSYSGGGYLVVQQLIEDVMGRSLADLAQELIFDKLGMVNSTFYQPLPRVYFSRAATAHLPSGEPVPGKWHTYPEQAAGGLWSTPSDLARLVVEMLKSLTGQSNLVLSPEMTRQMLTQWSRWYGMGFWINKTDGLTRFEHPGWNEGYHSYMGGCPGARAGVVWMTNGENGILLGMEVLRAMTEVLGWPGFKPVEKTLAQVDPAIFEQYVGKYRYIDEPDYIAEIIQDNESLFLQEAAGGINLQLYPQSETEFFRLEVPEKVTLVKNQAGKIEGMKIGEYTVLERVGDQKIIL